MAQFALDPRLEHDTVFVADLGLCMARLINDRRFPWLVLAPQRAGLIELTDLSWDDRVRLIDEIAMASSVLSTLAAAHKMNVAMLGNRVRQLHVHVIARTTTDAAWPDAVWGKGEPEPYEAGDLNSFVARLSTALSSPSP